MSHGKFIRKGLLLVLILFPLDWARVTTSLDGGMLCYEKWE